MKLNANSQTITSSLDDILIQNIMTNDNINQESFTNQQHDSIDCTSPSKHLFSELEELCLEWGSNYKDVQSVNTCPLDNFIALICPHIQELRNFIASQQIAMKSNLQSNLCVDICTDEKF